MEDNNHPTYKSPFTPNPVNLLKLRKKLEDRKEKEKLKNLLKKNKPVVEVSKRRKKSTAYVPEKDITLFSNRRRVFYRNKEYQLFIKQYKNNEPKLCINTFLKDHNGREYSQIVVKKIPYDVFLEIKDWFIKYSDTFDKFYKIYVEKKKKHTKDKLREDFTFSSNDNYDEIQQVIETFKEKNIKEE